MAPKIIVFSSKDKGKGKASSSSSSSSSSGTKRKSPPTQASSSSSKPKTLPPVPTYPWLPPMYASQQQPSPPPPSASSSKSKSKSSGESRSHVIYPNPPSPPPYNPTINPYSPRFGIPVSAATAQRTAHGVPKPEPEIHPNSKPYKYKDTVKRHDCVWVWMYKDYKHELVDVKGTACTSCQSRSRWSPHLMDKPGRRIQWL